MEIIRKKGQAVAAKRSDREASEGCVLAKKDGEFAAIIALKCETDFVAKNADFIALTQAILDAAVANRCKTLEEVKALPMGNGTVQDAVTDRSGITGEKMELDGYLGVLAGLLAGKFAGIYFFTWLVIKMGFAGLLKGMTWVNLTGVCLLGGIGFTVSLFIANLSFGDSPVLLTQAKMGVILGTVLAGVLAYLVLQFALPKQPAQE